MTARLPDRAWPARGARAAAGTDLAAAIGRAAVRALHDELALAPKPGLVSFADRGSHDDMDAGTFLRSLFALRGYFPAMARLGAQDAGFEALEQAGIAAEARMLRATGGINTHRGAVFTLGLLCAAAGGLAAQGTVPEPSAVRHALRARWGAALQARCARDTGRQGHRVAQAFGLRSAGQEAALGFPALFEVGVPALQAARADGLEPHRARLQAFFALMATLDDTNLVHRGGMDGLRFARQAAGDWLAAGGAAHPRGVVRAQALHREFVARRLSPGGAADLLAASCWMLRIAGAGAGADARAGAQAQAQAQAGVSAGARPNSGCGCGPCSEPDSRSGSSSSSGSDAGAGRGAGGTGAPGSAGARGVAASRLVAPARIAGGPVR